MKQENISDILYEEIDKLRECKTGEEINLEVTRANMIANIAEKMIAYGNMQLKAYDTLGDKLYKNNFLRITKK